VHGVQSPCDVRPVALEYVPRGHCCGAARPAGQYAPGVHKMGSTVGAGVFGHVNPAGHWKHADWPYWLLYVPAAQGVAAAAPAGA